MQTVAKSANSAQRKKMTACLFLWPFSGLLWLLFCRIYPTIFFLFMEDTWPTKEENWEDHLWEGFPLVGQ